MMRRLLHEPVLHFLLIGIALFVLYGRMAAPDPTGTRIVVSEAAIENLAREHQARWLRVPGDQELANLIEAYVRDEILYREGVAVGLDRDDPVIKRRVRQKLEVVAEEEIARDAPGDAELAAYLAQHADRFSRPATIGFEQILLPGAATAAEVEAARSALARGADPALPRNASLLRARVDDLGLDLVKRDFGTAFAAEVMQLPLATWAGPVRSGYGVHLVRVNARAPAFVPSLAEVRALVSREWENERRVASLAENYRALRAQYEVVIEPKKFAANTTP